MIPITARQRRATLIYTGSSFVPNISISAGKTVKLIWGDGQQTTVIGPVVATDYTHNYSSAGTYRFSIIGDLDGVNGFVYGFSDLSGNLFGIRLLTSIVTLYLQNTLVSGSISNFRGFASIYSLVAYDSSFSGNVSNLSDLNTLSQIRLYNTLIFGDLSSFNGLSSLFRLYVYNTSISAYTQGALPNWDGCDIYIQDLGLTQQEVDDFLCDLDTSSSASTKTLLIHGSNAAPSATGLACETSLEGKGWTVTVTGE